MRNGEERPERRERGGNGKYRTHRDMQTKQNAPNHNPIIPKTTSARNLCKRPSNKKSSEIKYIMKYSYGSRCFFEKKPGMSNECLLRKPWRGHASKTF